MIKNFIAFQRKRFMRIRLMDNQTIYRKTNEKIRHYFSYKNILRRIAYTIDKHSKSFFETIYDENRESGAVNIEHKLERLNSGGRFEPLDVELVNHGAVTLIGDARKILEIGCGTGMFASFAALDKDRHITASEFNKGALEWAKQNRSRDNINFCCANLDDVQSDEYDLVVSLEVIEHLDDYGSFLNKLAKVAPRAIISTPNKNRSAFDSVTNRPFYSDHVREWTAGEFYWVLKTFYTDVEIYTFVNTESELKNLRCCGEDTSNFKPTMMICSPLTSEPFIIASCSGPYRYTS